MVETLVILFLLFSVVGLFPFELNRNFRKGENLFFFIFCCILILVAMFREEGVDRDYESYVYWFDNQRDMVEWSFSIISDFIKKLGGGSIYIFIIYAILGVCTKVFAIKKMSAFPILSLVVYMGYLYPLQELTQIRAGVASGLILIAIYYKINKQIFYSIFFVILATSFHYSSVVIVPILFLNTQKFNKLFYTIAIVISYGGSAYLSLAIELIMDFLPPVIKWKIMSYERDTGAELNIFNAWQLLRIGVAFILIWNIERIYKYSPYAKFLLKVYVIGICSFALFSFNPVFAVRVSDLYFVVDIVLLPALCYLLPMAKTISKLVVITISALFLFLQVSYIGIFSN